MKLQHISQQDRQTIGEYCKRILRRSRSDFRIEVRELLTNGDYDAYGLYALPLDVEPADRDGWAYLHRVTIPPCDCWIDVQVAWSPDKWSEPEPMEWFRAEFSRGRLTSFK